MLLGSPLSGPRLRTAFTTDDASLACMVVEHQVWTFARGSDSVAPWQINACYCCRQAFHPLWCRQAFHC